MPPFPAHLQISVNVKVSHAAEKGDEMLGKMEEEEGDREEKLQQVNVTIVMEITDNTEWLNRDCEQNVCNYIADTGWYYGFYLMKA